MANTVEPIEMAQQPISDDQELAKVLAGINQQADDAVSAGVGTITPPAVTDVAAPPVEEPSVEATVPPVVEMPVMEAAPVDTSMVSGGADDLSSVKSEAINELRPLVDKLNVPAEEKFDTYLLLLRSTDDRSLVEPAHEVAKQITDEARRAQALLDIIKEIDFLSQSNK